MPGAYPAPRPYAAAPSRIPEGDKSYVVTVVFAYLLGVWGVDRYYLGKPVTATLKLLTFGGWGVWWLVDVLLTLCGGQRDRHGLRLAGYDRYKKTVWIVIAAIFGAGIAFSILSVVALAMFAVGGSEGFGWTVLSAFAAAVAAAGVVVWRRWKRARAAAPATDDATPHRLHVRLQQFAGLRDVYAAHAASGSDASAAVVRGIDGLAANTAELFARLRTKTDKAHRRSAETEYDIAFGKLHAALDRGYLLDIIENPGLWDDPATRIGDVQAALDAVNTQLVDNIRQVNASRGLVFELSLDDLAGTRKAMDDWQRDFDAAAGDAQDRSGA